MYDKNTLAKSTGASLGVVAIVGMLFMSTGMAFAAPVSAVGGFVISGDIEANDFVLYPDIDSTSNAATNGSNGEYPLAVNELNGVSIENFQLSKNISLAQYTGTNEIGGTATIVIAASDNVYIDNTLLKSPALQAEGATFRGFQIQEENTGNLEDTFQLSVENGSTSYAPSSTQDVAEFNAQSGPAIELNNADIRATYLVADQVSLSGLGLEVWYDSDNDGTYEYGGADESTQDSNAGANPGGSGN